MRILLIEDDEFISKALEKVLIEQHYVVDIATNGQAGWELVEAFTYDLIVLDVILPGLDGMRICRQLRDNGYQTPVLLLTAQNSSTDKVMGLDAGADDYVVKPFETSELLARIRVLLRRKHSTNLAVMEWLNLRLDSGICEVTYNGCTLNLTPKEYRLLELFLRNSHRVFSRGAILDHLWPSGESPSEDTVTVHIKDLRRKLKQAGAPADFIETVYGRGYRLKQSPSTTAANSVSPSPMPSDAIQQQTQAGLAIVWQKYKGLSYSRLAILQKASTSLLAKHLTDEERHNAQRAAHKLAGALGIFGFAQASGLAREIEEMFAAPEPLGQQQVSHLSELLVALTKILVQPAPNASVTNGNHTPSSTLTVEQGRNSDTGKSGRGDTRPLLLVLDKEDEFAEHLLKLAEGWGISMKGMLDLAAMAAVLQDHVDRELPDVILLNFSLNEATETDLVFLAERVNQPHPIPVLFLTAEDTLINRVKVSHVAAHAFLQHPLLPEQVLETLAWVRSQIQTTRTKVMLVDDDPQLLALMRTQLEPLGLQLMTLEQPLRVWHTLEAFAPDLIVLDLEMPELNGIELCRVLRHAPQWRELPIVFLTVHTEISTVRQIFAAGANECISKTTALSELVARILSRVKQGQLLRSIDNLVRPREMAEL
jgi:DNA-binding response OmpR family regulator